MTTLTLPAVPVSQLSAEQTRALEFFTKSESADALEAELSVAPMMDCVDCEGADCQTCGGLGAHEAI